MVSYSNFASIGNVDEIAPSFAITEIHTVNVGIMTDQKGMVIPMLVPVDTIFFAVDWGEWFPKGKEKK